jgi:hypothetical protein
LEMIWLIGGQFCCITGENDALNSYLFSKYLEGDIRYI